MKAKIFIFYAVSLYLCFAVSTAQAKGEKVRDTKSPLPQITVPKIDTKRQQAEEKATQEINKFRNSPEYLEFTKNFPSSADSNGYQKKLGEINNKLQVSNIINDTRLISSFYDQLKAMNQAILQEKEGEKTSLSSSLFLGTLESQPGEMKGTLEVTIKETIKKTEFEKYLQTRNVTLPEISCVGSDAITNKLPPGWMSWKYTKEAGCGIWATIICNRKLGLSSGEVTEKEWNSVADGTSSNSNGTSFFGIAGYYAKQGYQVSSSPFNGSQADYEQMKKDFDRGCDIKLWFARKEGDKFLDDHIETVTDVNPSGGPGGQGSATTNSWGTNGLVSGGTAKSNGGSGGFKHSRDDGNDFKGPYGGPAWPQDQANVRIITICPLQ